MRRRIVLFIIITLCFVLQTTLFKTLSFANISPNLLIIAVSSFGFMRGKKEGLWVGFFCGLLIDIFCGKYIGLYALIYMYIGFIKWIIPEKILSWRYKASYASDRRQRFVLQSGSILFHVFYCVADLTFCTIWSQLSYLNLYTQWLSVYFCIWYFLR